jgi:hypothetical protein
MVPRLTCEGSYDHNKQFEFEVHNHQTRYNREILTNIETIWALDTMMVTDLLY